MILIWLQFIIAGIIIIIAGTRLCFYADIISDRLNLSKAFIGIILLAVVTSLPELVTTLTSSIKLNAINLALGNIIGSNNFNLLIIVILDFIYRKGSITNKTETSREHILSATWSLLLMSIVALSIALKNQIGVIRIGNMGIDSMFIVVAYAFAIRLLSKTKARKYLSDITTDADKPGNKDIALSKAISGFAIASVFVIVSGMWLAFIGDNIADITGWGQTFVGSIFIAAATSFPELVVSIAALRMGSIDMAFGNIFGSNMFNMAIIPINDIIYKRGAILYLASVNHLLTAILGIVLICLVIAGLSNQKKKSFFGLGWDTTFMFIFYIIGNYFLLMFR